MSVTSAQHEHDHHESEENEGPPPTFGRHGMLLFGGDGEFYLSHLPMFMDPHNFQVLLSVTFANRVEQQIADDRSNGYEGIYTFDPELFPIIELDPSGPGPARSSMVGAIVRGHFERGGTPIAEGVPVDVQRVVHFTRFDVDEPRPDGQLLTYLCFGRPGRLYLAHHIAGRPSFDHILAARLVPGTVTNSMGSALPEDVATIGFEIAQPVRFGQREGTGRRLEHGDRVVGSFVQTASMSGAHGFRVEIEIEKELYLEVDELA